MKVDLFDYDLPTELIAKHPAEEREHSKLLVLHRDREEMEHRLFSDIIEYFRPGDCLVLNDSRVIPARLLGSKKDTGGKVEFLLTGKKEGGLWETMVRPGRRIKPGDTIIFSENPHLQAEIIDYGPGGTRIVSFKHEGDFMNILDDVGVMPLPPYIERESEEEDKVRYQTVYCRENGSVAAPTAGLHFTGDLLERIERAGVHIAYVTLHVGIGTFRPVQCDRLEDHKMHFEEYEIDEKNAIVINSAKAAGGRIISVGTTSVRTLESVCDERGRIKAGRGSTDIFIYPGYSFKIVDCLLTNFHLPKSTLLMLVSALCGRERILNAYETAISQRYRFFSYGDAMLIL
ncbi:MAG: tRNA preQ1(34) S-adenosylmethionine ribosyltransferase-isomerase QueA [Anaerovoracaceae bacterium]